MFRRCMLTTPTISTTPGPLLDSYGYRAAFAFAAVPAAMVVIPVAMGCLQERRLSAEARHFLIYQVYMCVM